MVSENENVEIKYSNYPENFLSDLLSKYLNANICAVAVATFIGYCFSDFIVKRYSEQHLLYFAFTGTFFAFGLLGVVNCIYALKEKFGVINKDYSYNLTKNGLLKLFKTLPRYMSDPEMETAHWVNNLLRRLWPLMQARLDIKINKILGTQRRLDFIGKINGLTNFRLNTVSLGTQVPSVTGVHVMQSGTKREIVVIDAEITYDSDIDVMFSGDFMLVAEIKRLYFRTTLRLVIGPLFRHHPIIGSIGVTLLDDPKVDWNFVGILRVMNMPCVKSLVSKIIADFLKNPRRLTVNLAKTVPKRERNIGEPNALLSVDIIEAKNLPRLTTQLCFCKLKPDAYCTVTVGTESRSTAVVTFNDNPEWNRTFNFVYDTRKKPNVELFVKDENFDRDVVIGGVVISLENIQKMNGCEVSIQLRDKDEGYHLYNNMGKASMLAIKLTYFRLSSKADEMRTQNILKIPVAAISVLIDYATGLETVAPQAKTTDMRPLVRINVGNQFQITDVKQRSGSPVWEESHHFLLFHPRSEFVHIEIIDVNNVIHKFDIPELKPPEAEKPKQNRSELLTAAMRGTVIGSVRLPVSNVLDSPQMKTEGFYQLDGYLENAYIKVLMAMRVILGSTEIADNYRKPRVAFPEENDPPPNLLKSAVQNQENQDVNREDK